MAKTRKPTQSEIDGVQYRRAKLWQIILYACNALCGLNGVQPDRTGQLRRKHRIWHQHHGGRCHSYRYQNSGRNYRSAAGISL